MEIYSKYNYGLIYRDDNPTMKETIEHACTNRISLSNSNLKFTYLRSINAMGIDLREADLKGANLVEANLQYANLQNANLIDANLKGSDLTGANLVGAILDYANLQDANLYGAELLRVSLKEVYLKGIKRFNKYQTSSMYSYLYQEKSRLFKIVDSHYQGIYKGGLSYDKDEVSVDFYDTNDQENCSSGINLATLDWCLKRYLSKYRILLCEFNREDIVCIPIGSDGKIRVKRCKIISELNLKEIGIESNV